MAHVKTYNVTVTIEVDELEGWTEDKILEVVGMALDTIPTMPYFDWMNMEAVEG